MTPHAPAQLAASMLDSLLGLKRLSWSDPRSQLGWRFDLPAWAWVLIVCAAVALAFWSYSRLLGWRPGRYALAVFRTVLVLVVAALLAGPMLVVPDVHTDPDWLLVLVDRSASLQITDVESPAAPAPDATDGLITRDRALRDALEAQHTVFTDEAFNRDRRIVWLGFGAETFEIDSPDTRPGALDEPDQQTTAIRTAIDQALQRAAGRPVAGIVMFTDGRSPESTGANLVRRLKQQHVEVYPVPLGSPITPLDLAIGRVERPDKAFINDIVPVNVWIDRYPSDAPVDPADVRVRLIDTATGKTLAEKKPDPDAGFDQPVRLATRSNVIGPVTWRVELVYDPPSPDATGRDLNPKNNHRLTSLELVNRAIRVLFVEGYPRWEYRYLKNMLKNEKSIQSSMMLVSADQAFAQEGDLPITRLPESPEEFDPYDVVIIGDVPSDYFSSTQIALLRDHVAARGAGLLWIGGEEYTPRTYDATPLADLLPMTDPAVVERLDSSFGPVFMTPTPLAQQLNVLRLTTRGGADAGDGRLWPEHLPPIIWAQQTGKLKPTVELFATARSDTGQTIPLVMRMRYGAGQSVYVASDETWRWRFGRGSHYFQQFWIQLVQMLGRSRLQQQNSRVWLDVSYRRPELDQPVVVDLRVKDELLLRRELPRVSVSVYRADDLNDESLPGGGGGRPVERIELAPQPSSDSPGGGAGNLTEIGVAGGQDGSGSSGARQTERRYQTIWRPTVAGRLVLRVDEPALADLNITQQVEVIRPDDEVREPATDHPRLTQLADETGGRVVPLDQLDQLHTLVRNRAQATPNDIREPLWDSPLALALVIVLLTVEWIGRKLIKLV